MLKFLLALTSSSFKKKKERTKINGIDIFLLRVAAYKGVSYTWESCHRVSSHPYFILLMLP